MFSIRAKDGLSINLISYLRLEEHMALRQYWFEKKRDAANTPIDVARVLQNRLAPVAGGHKRSADVTRNYQAMGGKYSLYVCIFLD